MRAVYKLALAQALALALHCSVIDAVSVIDSAICYLIFRWRVATSGGRWRDALGA